MEVATRNLIQSVAVYLPDEEGQRFYATSGDASFGLEEGPVGRAAATGAPVVELSDSPWATVAIPCPQGDRCRGVVALYCEAADGLRGAVEVWRRNERGELGLAEHWYPGLDRLGRISQYVKFPRRAGLPGRVWDDRFPRVLGALQDSKNFIRVAAARSERLVSAIGIPFMARPPELDAVMLLLNTQDTPLAKVMEVWARDLESGQLKIVSADYGPFVAIAEHSRRLTLRKGDGVAGRVFRDGEPWVTSDLLGAEFPRGDRFVEHGFERGIGLPVYVGSDLVACVNLYT